MTTENQYKKRHDVANALHWSLSKKHQLACSNKSYEHKREGVIENDQAKILSDYGIETGRHVPTAVTLIDKIKKKVSFIDVAIPWDTRVDEKEREKIFKYQVLKTEIRRIWNMPVETEPIIIGTQGTIPEVPEKESGKTRCRSSSRTHADKLLLETAHIVRKVMDS
ncbi:uncharacterized protein [Macrobrachium rosenbergii]|uniref:uncharacterized protein n=1 Tax=Macrobrachium rosenbergii TaxID=79674 RepID=UPI0034D604EB